MAHTTGGPIWCATCPQGICWDRLVSQISLPLQHTCVRPSMSAEQFQHGLVDHFQWCNAWYTRQGCVHCLTYLQALLMYAAFFFANMGNYKSFGDTKVVPSLGKVPYPHRKTCSCCGCGICMCLVCVCKSQGQDPILCPLWARRQKKKKKSQCAGPCISP